MVCVFEPFVCFACLCSDLLNCAVECFVCDVLCDVVWFVCCCVVVLVCVFCA